MDKSKKIDILQIETQITKFIKDWIITKRTGLLSVEIYFSEGGIRNVDVNENTKFKIK